MHLLMVTALLLAWSLSTLGVGYAATFTVTDPQDLPDSNLADPLCRSVANTCTLRAAIEQANATAALDSINIRPGFYQLTRGHLTILTSMSLRGVTEDETEIHGVVHDGLIRIGQRTPRMAVPSVSLSRLTLSGGKGFTAENFPTGETGGAVIVNEGSTLALERVKVQDNEALQGGGIANLGTLVIRRSSISRNFAGGRGFNASGGGGLTNGQSDLLTTSRRASMRIEESTISDNVADKQGAGISNVGTLTIINSTISGNRVTGGATFTSGGGGIWNDGTASGQSVTITDNTGDFPAQGGGIFNTANGQVTLSNTILGENQALDGPDCMGGIRVDGFNVVGTARDCTLLRPFQEILSGSRTLVGVKPQLAPLKNNGGPTHTHALCTGPGQPDFVCDFRSPAIDPVAQTNRGPVGNNQCPPRDQRGFTRPPLTPITIPIFNGPPRVILLPIGPHASCDMGAFDAFAVP